MHFDVNPDWRAEPPPSGFRHISVKTLSPGRDNLRHETPVSRDLCGPAGGAAAARQRRLPPGVTYTPRSLNSCLAAMIDCSDSSSRTT
jgi:hypothetical protein